MKLTIVPAKEASEKQHIVYHKHGSLWVKGKKAHGLPTGYAEWFRKDGTRLAHQHQSRPCA
jgi:hypothetical protein